MRTVGLIAHAVLRPVPLLLMFALLLAVPSFAQQGQCGPRDAVARHLADKYGETRRSLGLAANNTVMEVWASAGTGSWTITVTTPQGMTCLVASGQNFEPVDDPAGVPGVPG